MILIRLNIAQQWMWKVLNWGTPEEDIMECCSAGCQKFWSGLRG